ncbi:hypothetical protein CJ030_MR2G007372 [Morella rubra]|uniref:Pentatricopeptide repeat-containing protein n=1 Tax=Morella rubra TaxID=262757 RepID=A0A6A1WF96_9ROSI|nr:hypothetical protein CJ030_MR2G007372 [Morella rubra]
MMAKQSMELVRDGALSLLNTLRDGAHQELLLAEQGEYNQASLPRSRNSFELDSNEFCESGFINLYSKAEEFENAREVFAQNLDRKLGSWNALIGGLSQGGRAKEAIGTFMELRKCGFLSDDVTMVSVTSACGSLGGLDLALQLHKCAFQAKPIEKPDILMMNSLIDIYGKCYRMNLANKVFSRMDVRNVSSWTSMIFGYPMHGRVQEALEWFGCMREAGERPNHVTFVAILTACVHGGKAQKENITSI